jgi:hypothetical protein
MRGGAYLPHRIRADFSVAQDLFFKVKNSTQKFQIRADILNFGNFLNKDWGVGKAFATTQPLVVTSTSSTATCRPTGADTTQVAYCLQRVGGNLITSSYVPTANSGDVYRIQIGIRYIFNK